MKLLDELQEYRQPNGFYSNQKNPGNDSSGNCIAITSLALMLAYRIGEFNNPYNLKYIREFEKELGECEIIGFPGLINRSPTKVKDQEGWDDYVLLLAVTGKNCLNLSIASSIHNHGKKYLWSFNNESPGKFTFKSFLGRYPIFISHTYFALNLTPNLFLKLYWCLGILLSLFSKDSTSDVLYFSVIETEHGMSLICTIAHRIRSIFKKKEILKNQIGLWLSVSKDEKGNALPNLEHPIVKYWL